MNRKKTTLSATEQCDLKRLEAVIQKGEKSFRETALALCQIREQKLFRDHGTFSVYVEETFPWMSRRYADYLAKGGEILSAIRNSSSQCDLLPVSEAQTRELAKADPDDRQMTWESAVDLADGDQPTAAEIERARQIVEEVEGPEALAKAMQEETEAAARRGQSEREENDAKHREKKLKLADDRLHVAVRWYRCEGLGLVEIQQRLEAAWEAAEEKAELARQEREQRATTKRKAKAG